MRWMQTWRWTELLQMPNVAITGRHSYTHKHLVKFATALLMCSCGSSSQTVCRESFNSSVVLGFGWGLFYCSSIALMWQSRHRRRQLVWHEAAHFYPPFPSPSLLFPSLLPFPSPSFPFHPLPPFSLPLEVGPIKYS